MCWPPALVEQGSSGRCSAPRREAACIVAQGVGGRIVAGGEPRLHVLGLSDGHLRDAMAEIALNLIASGTSLAYGGDLRQHGFTELLAELLRRYRNTLFTAEPWT